MNAEMMRRVHRFYLENLLHQRIDGQITERRSAGAAVIVKLQRQESFCLQVVGKLQRDPVECFEGFLARRGLWSEGDGERLREEALTEISAAAKIAEEEAAPGLETRVRWNAASALAIPDRVTPESKTRRNWLT